MPVGLGCPCPRVLFVPDGERRRGQDERANRSAVGGAEAALGHQAACQQLLEFLESNPLETGVPCYPKVEHSAETARTPKWPKARGSYPRTHLAEAVMEGAEMHRRSDAAAPGSVRRLWLPGSGRRLRLPGSGLRAAEAVVPGSGRRLWFPGGARPALPPLSSLQNKC